MFFSRGGRIASSVLAVALLVSVVGLAAPAAANHPSSCLDLTPETATNAAGTNHTITATLRVVTAQCTGGAVTPNNGPVNIDFEIQGSNDVDEGNSPHAPDLTCSIVVGASSCTVTYSGDAAGFDSIRGWIDHDGLTPAQGGTTEADLNEDLDDADSDTTDVVNKSWSAGAASEVDCDDQTGPDTERETNPSLSGAASNERYVCTVTDAAGNPIGNEVVSGEVTSGANDPDATDAASFDSRDYACTTGAGGTCDVTVTQAEAETGT
ncbi:MAG TPA: hypothetical protein VHJ76_04440, partial [Actinomycetota bacterium]|nr:hypothetical protein [Actinomycetota bacterium]